MVTVLVPRPSALELVIPSTPLAMVTLPVKVLSPDRTQVPLPSLVTEVLFVAELSTMAPAISPMPAVDPRSARFLLPAPVAVKSLVNLSKPVPDWSR